MSNSLELSCEHHGELCAWLTAVTGGLAPSLCPAGSFLSMTVCAGNTAMLNGATPRGGGVTPTTFGFTLTFTLTLR